MSNPINQTPFHGLTKAPLTYLAVPYSYACPDKRVKNLVQQFRFETATRAAGWLMTKFGWNVFSPITHSHPMHLMCPDIRGDWEFWKTIDTEYLQLSFRIVTLTLPGWRKSTGVTTELEIANQCGIESLFLHPSADGFKISETPEDHVYNIDAALL
jgi:hypothetical protein